MRSRGAVGHVPANSRTPLILGGLALLLGACSSMVSGAGNPPQIVEHKREYTFQLGQSLKLVCPVVGGKMVIYTWEKGEEGDSIGEFHDRYKVLKRGRGRVLKSKKGVTLDDRGIYTCNGVNGFGRKTVSMIVHVIDPSAPIQPKQCARLNGKYIKGAPCFIDMTQMQPQRIVKKVGEKVTMTCSARGDDLIYSWKKDSNTAGWISTAEGFGTSMFTIRDLQLAHTGRYTCSVKNNLGELKYQYTLSVQSSSDSNPQFVDSDPQNITVGFGQRAQLVCRVKSDIRPYIRWMKHLVPRQKASYKDMKKGQMDVSDLKKNLYAVLKHPPMSKDANDIYVSKMIIRKVMPADIGKYMCVVFGRNSKNIIYQATFLHIRNYRPPEQRNGDGVTIGVNAANPFHLIVYIAVPLCVLVVCIGVIIYCLVSRHTASMAARGAGANTGARVGGPACAGYVMKPYSGSQNKYSAQPVPQYEPYPLPNTAVPSPPACYPSYHSSSSNGYSAGSGGGGGAPVAGRAYNT